MCSSHLLGDDEGRGHAQYPSFLLALHNGGWVFFFGGGSLLGPEFAPTMHAQCYFFFFWLFFFFICSEFCHTLE